MGLSKSINEEQVEVMWVLSPPLPSIPFAPVVERLGGWLPWWVAVEVEAEVASMNASGPWQETDGNRGHCRPG